MTERERFAAFLDTAAVSMPNETQSVRELWRAVTERFGDDAPLPYVGLHKSCMHVAWDSWRYHLDVDIFFDWFCEWFFKDRKTNELDGTVEGRDEKLPERFFERMALLVANDKENR